MKTLWRSAGILIALTLVFSIQTFAANSTSDDATSLSVGGLALYDRDFKHNAAPFKFTNETTITVELIGLMGRVDNLYLAENDQLTSNVQARFRPPLGDYDGGTTFTFILTPENGDKTIWAVAQNQTEFSFPPTTGTITLDTNPPCFNMRFTKSEKDVRVAVAFSEDVHGFDAADIVLGGAGGTVKQFNGKGSHYIFWITPNDPKNIKVSIRADDIWDTAGNPAQQVNMAPAVEELQVSAVKQAVYSTGSNIFENITDDGLETLTSDPIWVDFYWLGVNRIGTESYPFNCLTEALQSPNCSEIRIKPGCSTQCLRITKAVRLVADSGAVRIGGAGASQYGHQVRWYDSDGNVVAWLDDIGRLFLTGTVHTNQTPPTNLEYVWFLRNSNGIIYAGISTTGDLYLQGGFSTNPMTSDSFHIANPNDPASALISVSSDGVMHLLGSSSNYVDQLIGPEDLPGSVTAHCISPLFPTPNSVADLPSRYQSGTPTTLTPLEILSMFVFYPNMRWNDVQDGIGWEQWDGSKILFMKDLRFLRALGVNSPGGDWGRPIHNPDGNMYVLGADGRGYQKGFSLMNRCKGYSGFFDQYWGPNYSFHRIAGFKPGVYAESRNSMPESPSTSRASTLGWYTRHPINGRINVFRINVADEDAKRIGYRACYASQLWLGGDLYEAFYEEYRGQSKDSNPEKPVNAGIFRIKNIDSWNPGFKAAEQYNIDNQTSGILSDTGRRWEDDPNHRFSVLTPSGTFTDMYSKNGSVYQNFDNQVYDPTNGVDNFLWKKTKFTTPAFIQFGPGYSAYAEPDANASLLANQRYVYAISNHNHQWGEDALYLGRSLVTLREGATDTTWGPWQYYIGTDTSGNPIWTTGTASDRVDLAKSILYGNGEMGHPSIIYNPTTQLYILATFTTNNSTMYTSVSHHYTLHVARRPWGPWRKVFTNDYNGLIYRAAQDMRRQGGSPYDVHLLTHPIDATEYNASTKSGKVRFWLTFGGLYTFNRDFVPGRTGALIANLNWFAPADGSVTATNELAPWDEFFKQSYYTLCCQEIELNIQPGSEPTAAVPAVVKHTYPEFRMEGQYHYDHWGWKPIAGSNGLVTSADFSLNPKWFGYKFKVGSSNIDVSELGRFYMSGNTHPHVMKILDANGGEVANATVSPGAGGAGASIFSPPSGEVGNTRLAADGYLYTPLTSAITLQANQNYYLLSREGIDGYSGSNHALERIIMPTVAPTVHDSTATICCGYRFRTGPLGLRVTALYRLASLASGQTRRIFIEEALSQVVNGKGDEYTRNDIFRDEEKARVLDEYISSSNTINIQQNTYYYLTLQTPLDLKPLTDYYIGIEVKENDGYYKAPDSANHDNYRKAYYLTTGTLARIHFNPNAFQFIHPARVAGAISTHSWTSLDRRLQPSIADNQPFDDGVGLSPAVEYPIFFDYSVPDRFEGYRNQLYTGVYNNDRKAMDKSANTNAEFNMPMMKSSSFDSIIAPNIEVLGASMSERMGPYTISDNDTTIPLRTNWYEDFAVFHTFGAQNTTFGPLDLVFKGQGADKYLFGTENRSLGECYYNAGAYQENNTNIKVDVYENRRFVNPTDPEQDFYKSDVPHGIKPGILSGMQIKITDHDTSLTKVGRYFQPGIGGGDYKMSSHPVVVVQTRDNTLLAVGRFVNGEYGTGNKFAYASLKDPTETTTITLSLRRGESYTIGVWDFKNGNMGTSDADDLTNRQFGLIEDYPRLSTGSSISIIGPTTATDSGGNPVSASLKTICLDTAGTGFSQGYGPLNMIYNTQEGVVTPYASTLGVTSNGFTGFVGIQVDTGAKPVVVTHVGRYKVNGNSGVHQLMIMKKKPGNTDVNNGSNSKPSEIMCTVTVDAREAAEADGYNYARLEQPVVLEPNASYYVASYENSTDYCISSGSISRTSSILWNAASIVASFSYRMTSAGGNWTSTTFAPITNMKAQ